MTTGFGAAGLANVWLDQLDGSAVKLHTGDPGVAGTSNASAETTRKALTFSAASAGSKAAVATLPSWATWSAGSETLTHISLWTATSGGTFRLSLPLTASKAVANGDTVNLTSLTIALIPIAA